MQHVHWNTGEKSDQVQLTIGSASNVDLVDCAQVHTFSVLHFSPIGAVQSNRPDICSAPVVKVQHYAICTLGKSLIRKVQ